MRYSALKKQMKDADRKIKRDQSAKKEKSVQYYFSIALMDCDCGQPVHLSQTIFGDSTFRGDCVCGLNWELKANRYKIVEKPKH